MDRISVNSIFSALALSLTLLFTSAIQSFANTLPAVAMKRSVLIADIERNCLDRKLVDRIPSLLVTFESRMADKVQIEATYQEISEMLAAATSVTSLPERAQLAAQIIEQSACPLNINQGRHNTCAFAAIEARTYTLYPRAAASLVKQVALTGRYLTGDNEEIVVEAANVHPDTEAESLGYGRRSFASQLFQITAGNVYWHGQTKDPNGIKCGRGNIRYVQKAPYCPSDTGERLEIHRQADVVETVMDDYGQPACEPCVSLGEIQDVGTVLAQVPQTMFVIAGKTFRKDQKHLFVKSVEDLRTKLSDCQNGSAMPLVAAVQSGHGWLAKEPRIQRLTAGKFGINQMHQSEQLRLSNNVPHSGWHAVCVTAYNVENDTVSIDNFWGAHADHVGGNSIPVSELYAAISPTSN